MTFGTRLKILRQEKGLTQAQFGACFNLAESTISLYETGKRTPHYDILKRFALFFNITIDFLLGYSEERYPPSFIGEENETYGHKIKDKPIKVPIVNKIETKEHFVDYQYVPDHQEWIASSFISDGQYFWLKVADNRLSGEAIIEGDIVLIREQACLNSGEIGLVLFNEIYYVVRVYTTEDSTILQSSNPAFPPIILTGKECSKARILGKVIQLRRIIAANNN